MFHLGASPCFSIRIIRGVLVWFRCQGPGGTVNRMQNQCPALQETEDLGGCPLSIWETRTSSAGFISSAVFNMQYMLDTQQMHSGQ